MARDQGDQQSADSIDEGPHPRWQLVDEERDARIFGTRQRARRSKEA
jgi:hypothetical protein